MSRYPWDHGSSRRVRGRPRGWLDGARARRARRCRCAGRAARELGWRDCHRNGPQPCGPSARECGGRTHPVALSEADPAGAVRSYAPEGVDRIIEVAFSDNIDLDAAVVRNETIIAAYATHDERPSFPFWPMLFDNVVIRLLGSDDFPAEAKERAAADLTTAARDGALSISIGEPFPLDQIADAHDHVDAGSRERVLIAIND